MPTNPVDKEAKTLLDSHVHLWDPARFPMPWLGGLTELERPFTLGDYAQEAQGVPVEGLIYVEAGVAPKLALAEASWAASLAARDPRLLGVVAHAPLELGDGVQPHLDALAALGPAIRGVRRNVQDEQDQEFCLQETFLRGTRLLPGYGLSFDICVRHSQLPAATELVRRCPETRFILDHLGKPAVKAGSLEPWRRQLGELAALPNVACKLSGLTTEADAKTWTAADLSPYIETVLAAFGSGRVMFGSDWPVMRLAARYGRWVELCETHLAELTPRERRNVRQETARRWYRLEDRRESSL